jgi:hypothetical protein
MRQFLISRFNLYIREFRGRAGLTEENYDAWCESRVALFRTFTLPSILAQENHDFRWFIGFDTEPNAHVLGLLKELHRHDFIVPVAHNNRPGPGNDGLFADAVSRLILCSSDDEPVCTTRIDTDDCLARSFMRIVRDEATAKIGSAGLPFAIDLASGAQYSRVPYEQCFMLTYKNNPFLSVIEKPAPPLKTAMGFAHYDAEKLMSVFRVETAKPMWLQVIHGGNAANRIRPEAVEAEIDLMSDFVSIYNNPPRACRPIGLFQAHRAPARHDGAESRVLGAH